MTDEEMRLTMGRIHAANVLEPDRLRGEAVRLRCQTAIARRKGTQTLRSQPDEVGTPLASRLVYVLSIGYLTAMIYDLARIYLRG